MKSLTGFLVLGAALMSSCTTGPEPLSYGKDVCEHCKMMVMDPKFGAEIVTARGKIFKFDATECMVDFIQAEPEKFQDPKDLFLATNIAAPGTLIDATTAFFLKDKAFRSPMGANLAAFASQQLAQNNHRSADGRIMTWHELLKTH